MAYYPDLTPYVYWPERVVGGRPHPDGVEILNVGWLEPGHDFPTSGREADPAFLECLITLVADHETALTRGIHGCGLFHPDGEAFGGAAVFGDRDLFLGHGEVHVVTLDGRWLAAPTMVVHYVRDHGYRPPNEFIEAVKAMRVAPKVDGW